MQFANRQPSRAGDALNCKLHAGRLRAFSILDVYSRQLLSLLYNPLEPLSTMNRAVKIKPSALFVSLAAVVVLTSTGPLGIGASKAAPQVPQDTLIMLERTPCYGTCPSYKLTISADGAVVFVGRRFVRQEGTVQSTISQEGLRELTDRFAKINYFELRDRYEEPGDGCKDWSTDGPSAITSITTNGKSKSVRHYYGCQGIDVLADLTRLEQAIDDAVNSAQWIR